MHPEGTQDGMNTAFIKEGIAVHNSNGMTGDDVSLIKKGGLGIRDNGTKE